MQNASNYGHNYFPAFTPPDNDESVQVVLRPWRPLLECLREIPAHYLWEQMRNAPYECCRDPENLELEIRKTKEQIVTPEGKQLTYPDLYVMRCGCKRQHRRFLVEPMHMGNQAKKPKTVHNPFFKENSDDTGNTASGASDASA